MSLSINWPSPFLRCSLNDPLVRWPIQKRVTNTPPSTTPSSPNNTPLLSLYHCPLSPYNCDIFSAFNQHLLLYTQFDMPFQKNFQSYIFVHLLQLSSQLMILRENSIICKWDDKFCVCQKCLFQPIKKMKMMMKKARRKRFFAHLLRNHK